MGIVDREYSSFSTPSVDPGERRRLAERVITTDVAVHLRSFLRRERSELAARSEGLLELLDAAGADLAFGETRTLPLALSTFRAEGVDPVWTAASTAAHLTALGRPGRWRGELIEPRRVRFGPQVAPPAKVISAERESSSVIITLDDGPPHTLGHAAPGWSRLTEVTSFGAPSAVLGGASQDAVPVDEDAPFAEVADDVALRTIDQAAQLLERHAPPFFAWVRDVLAAVVPIRSPRADATQSYSRAGMTGVLYASFPVTPLKLAELLVHEASHTYHHVGQLDTLFTNGMDSAIYFSPYVQKDRAIDRILIAFHAFANIALFYRAALAGGLEEGRALAEEAIAFHLRHLPAMRDQLDRSPGLSPAGRGLYEPLREELFR